jgi:hypothetical protein
MVAQLHAAAAAARDTLLNLVLTGEYSISDDAATPLFLRRDVYDAAQRLGCGPERLRYHVGYAEEVAPKLAEASRSFDLIAASNIRMSDMTVEYLKPALAPGGAIMYCSRGEKPGFVAEVFESNGLHEDSAVNARLLSCESCYMSAVYAAFLPGDAPPS